MKEKKILKSSKTKIIFKGVYESSKKVLTIFLIIMLIGSFYIGLSNSAEASKSTKKSRIKEKELVFQLDSKIDNYNNILEINEKNSSKLNRGIKPGAPNLPYQEYQFILPPNVDFESIELNLKNCNNQKIRNEYNFQPMPYPVKSSTDKISKKDAIKKNKEIYQNDSYYPGQPILNFETHRIRDAKIAKIDYAPLSWNPSSKKVIKHKNVSVRIRYTETKSNIDSLTYEFLEASREQFDNFDKIASLYKTSSEIETTSQSSYVIITTETIKSNSNKLDEFKGYIEEKGYNTLVITEEDYGEEVGQERAINIKDWLSNNYQSQDIKYALLIGDPDPDEPGESDSYGDVPMMMCYPNYTEEQTSYKLKSPTDYFYADLTGDWDLNGDSHYGDYYGDKGSGGVDFNAEVYVGRIPVYNDNYNNLDNILENIINYREKYGDWKKRALVPTAMHNYENEDYSNDARTDSLDYPEHLYQNILNPNGFSDAVMYERSGINPVDTSAFHYSQPISNSNVKDAINYGYGVISWWAHGSRTGASRKYWSSDDGNGVPEPNEMTWSSFLSSSDASQLENDQPAFFYQSSCKNGYPEDSSNLGYSLLKNGVGISTVSASRNSYYLIGTWSPHQNLADNTGIGYYYLERLLGQNMSCGKALAETKSFCGNSFEETSWMNKFDFNLYGDPSLSYSQPPEPEITSVNHPSSIELGETATVEISGRLTGSTTESGNLHIATPDLPDEYADKDHFWEVYNDTDHVVHKWPGDTAWGDYGNQEYQLTYPFIEASNSPWEPSDGTETLEVKTKPTSTGPFTIEVKMTAGGGGNWYGDPAKDGSESNAKDQQNEYVYEYTIDVVPQNDPPNQPSNPTPSDEATGVSFDQNAVQLEADVSDPDGDTMDVTFYDASDDSQIGTDNSVQDGGTASVTWNDPSGHTHEWYAVADDGSATKSSLEWTFETENREPNTPDTPDGPTEVGEGEEVEYEVVTTDLDGDDLDVYEVDWGDGTTSLANGAPSGDKITVHNDWSSPGTYQVKVRARDTYGDWSDWSNTLGVNVKEIDIGVYGPSDQMEDSTDTHTYDYTVENQGEAEVTSDITVDSSNSDWSASLKYSSDSTITLSVDESKTVPVEVTIPSGVTDGESSDITLTASDQDTDEESSDTFTVTGPDYDVTVSDKSDETETAPDTYTYSFTVSNPGNVDETYDLSIDKSNPDWQASIVGSTTRTISAGGSENVDVEVTIPSSASDEDTSDITLTAESQSSSVSDFSSFTLTYDPDLELNVEAPSDQTEDASGDHTYQYEIINNGTTDLTCDLDVSSSNSGWSTTVDSSVEIGAGETKTVTVTVAIPTTASPGDSSKIELTATAQSNTSTDGMTVNYDPDLGVNVNSPSDSTKGSSGTYPFDFSIENTGDVTDTYDVSITSSNSAWSVSPTEDEITIESGQTKDLTVQVTIPSDVNDGESSEITISVTSKNDSSTSDTGSITVTYSEDNSPPNEPANPSPSDGDTGVSTSPELSVDVSDPDGDTMEVTFYASDDSEIGSNSGVSDGTTTVTWDGLSSDTTYGWYVKIDDGQKTVTTKDSPWSFTTAGDYGVNVQTHQDVTVNSSGTYTHSLQVQNTGENDDTYTLDATSSSWSVDILTESPLSISGGDTKTVELEITVPNDASPRDESEIRLSVSGEAKDSESFLISYVPNDYGVKVLDRQGEIKEETGTYDFDFEVKNTGKIEDSYTLDVSIDKTTWDAGLSRESVSIQPGNTENITVSVTIPTDASENEEATFVFTATSSSQESVEDTDDIKVKYDSDPTPPPKVSIDLSDTEIKVDENITCIANSSGENLAYEWTFGDGTTKTGQEVKHSYDSSGEYTVTLTVVNEYGKTNTSEKTVHVSSETEPSPSTDDGILQKAWFIPLLIVLIMGIAVGGYYPLRRLWTSPDADILLYSPQGVEAGGLVTMRGEEVEGDISEWLWNFGDGTTARGRVIQHRFNNPGTYEVQLTVKDDLGRTGKVVTPVEVLGSEEKKMKCSHCGHISSAETANCTVCGSFLTEDIERKVREKKESIGCPECGRWTPRDSNNCIHCGTGFKKEAKETAREVGEVECATCGYSNLEGSSHCIICGTSLEEEIGEDKLECPECGHMNAPDGTHCIMCGSTLEEKVSETREIECPECGYENDADSSHCVICGTRLEEGENIECPECGYLSLVDYTHCIKCGSILRPEAEVDERIECPDCGHMNTPDSNHCITCGSVLEEVKPEVEEKMECPDCGFTNTADSEHCIKCGAVLGEVEGEIEEAKEDTIECPTCGEVNTVDNSHCIYCGSTLEEGEEAAEELNCPKCGYGNTPDSAHCIKCGTELGEAESESDSAAEDGSECPECGQVNPEDSKHCIKCGEELLNEQH